MIMEIKTQIDTVTEELCPICYSMNIVGGKWKLPLICLLADGQPKKYGVLRRNLPGITGMMISQSLRELETYGIVCRKQYKETPSKTEYTLSEEGKNLLPALQLISHWGADHIERENAESVHCERCQAEFKNVCCIL